MAGAATVEGADRDYALALADCWNERVEDLTYLRGGELSHRFGIDGHYMRIGPRSGQGDLRSSTRSAGPDHPPVPGVPLPVPTCAGSACATLMTGGSATR